jgi:hypothetical protein
VKGFKTMHNADDIVLAKEFLNFMVDYYALTRRHTIETNEYRSNSHGFSMLYVLRNYQNQPITMSKFADEMGITKQQLSKLVNDLEEKEYVERIHNKENRRQVYISITQKGLEHLEVMIGELMHEVMRALSGFTAAEKRQIEKSAVTLSELFRKDAAMCQEKRDGKSS